MGLRLVDDELDVSFDIALAQEARAAFGIQLQRSADSPLRQRFERLLSRQLQDLLDADLRPPTEMQLVYALAIARALDISLPGEVLRYRGSMSEFLDRFGPLFKLRDPSPSGD